MSFLTRTALRSTRTVALAPRAFSTSFAHQKVVPDTVKDAADKVNRVAGQKIVDGIELGGMFLPPPQPRIPNHQNPSALGGQLHGHGTLMEEDDADSKNRASRTKSQRDRGYEFQRGEGEEG